MSKVDSIIRHAITPPVFDKGKLHRERLVDRLHADIPKKLIALASPPGYGKSTLLADFTHQTDLPVCWVRLTDADRDVMRLVSVLWSSLSKRFRRLRGRLDLARLTASKPEAFARIITEVINDQVAEAFVLVLDDVQILNTSTQALEFMDALLKDLPDQMTIIASGREVLEVSLAELMASGALAGMGPADLALDEAEVEALSTLIGDRPISEVEIARILNETRGWITGVLLSGKLSGSGVRDIVQDSKPLVYEYLASVVLNRLPDDLRRFMLDSAIFPMMSAEACDYVLERKDSSRVLTRLVRESLFITSSNDSPRTYEFHPQLREFLLQLSAGVDKKKLKSLRMRAAEYFEQGGSPEYAIELLCDGGAIRKAASLAEKQAQDLYRQGRWFTLEAWSDTLADAGAEVPNLLLYRAMAYFDQGRYPQAREALDRSKTMIGNGTSKEIKVLALRIEALLAIHQEEQYDEALEAIDTAEKLLTKKGSRYARALCLRIKAQAEANGNGDLAKAERILEEAIRLLDSDKHGFTLASAMIDLSNYQAYQGKTLEAHSTSIRAHQLLLEVGSPSLLANSLNNLAFDAYMDGQFEDALTQYNEALKFARQAASQSLEANILFGQADVFSDLGMGLQAAELYGQGLNIAAELESNRLIQYGCIHTAVLHRRQGGSALASDWLKRAQTVGGASDDLTKLKINKTILGLEIKPAETEAALSAILDDDQRLDAFEKTTTMYYLARAIWVGGDSIGAIEQFRHTVDWAGLNGTQQILASELILDTKFRDYLRKAFSDHPVFSVVLRRIETMNIVSQRYQQVSEPEPDSERVTFQALGSGERNQADEVIHDLKPLAREVLYYLVDRRRVERDVLLETFWPHHPPGRQVANLHTAIYSLRRVLGKESIRHDGTCYVLEPEHQVDYDVEQFERAASIAENLPPGDPRRLFALTEAINSYHGAYLPEFTSDWALERRRDLELRYLDLLAHHAEEALVRDQPHRALQTLRQALEIDPYRDDTNYQLLEALGRLGRRREVVEHYQRFIHLLAEDLGLDPSEEIRNLYTRLIS
jgi:ATP/maltotriose-dependent transcriptional regulator MalT/two-component SAPR family response regulator